MKEEIKKLVKDAILSLQKSKKWPVFNVPEIIVDYPQVEKFGDYTTNAAMVLAKSLKKNPMEVAEILKLGFRKFLKPSFRIEKIEVVAPGYINFCLSKKYLQNKIAEINKEKEKFGNLEKKNEKIMVEYSQPNTHKEFHIGHLRNLFIGSAIVNLLKKAGNQVIVANYIGDAGTHVAKCLWMLDSFYKDKNLDEIENKAEFLGQVYSEAVKKIEENQEYEKQFKETQKKFEEGNQGLVNLWQKTRQWSLDDFNSIYKELEVYFDVYFYESEEERDGKKMLPELLKRGAVEESQGAIIGNLEKYGLGVIVLQRADGSVLYGLKDIPLSYKKFEQYKIDKSVIVADIRQELYFKQIFKILQLLGFKEDMVHVGYEFVSLKGSGGMSSRKGNIIPARKLISEVTEKIKNKFSRSPNPLEISLGAIKFSILKHSNRSKIEFDIEESVALEGATGPFVQYAHARICSILRKSQIPNPKSQTASKAKTQNSKLELLVHPKELSLMRELNKFPELVSEIAESYEVHKLPHYAIELADKFHSFYNACRVIDKKNPSLTNARLILVIAVKIVLAETLRLIGVSAPERM